MLKYFSIAAILLGIYACQERSEQKVLAEVYGEKLLQAEVDQLLGADLSYEDSVFIVKEYINSWVKRQVVLHESKTVLSENERDKSRQLQAYLNDLLSYETLNKLAVQQIDSNFSDQELMDYYQANLDEFELSENIIKLVFFKLPSSLENINELWEKFNSDQLNYEEFKTIAIQHGGNYSTDSGSWVFFNDILKEIPIDTYSEEHFLNNNKNIKINEGTYRYFVKILDFRIKSGISPFELERERVKKILFVKEQKETVKKIETELVEKAYNSNKVVIH